MKTKTYSELLKEILSENSSNYNKAMNSLTLIKPILAEKYHIDKEDIDMDIPLFSEVPFISCLAGESIKGKRILDLGCGSRTSKEMDLTSRVFEPWLCRALKELGAYPVGIDKEDNSEEEFESYQVDLMGKDSLVFLPTNSFDIANMRGLLTSKGFEGRNYQELILPQLERVVKSEGYFLYTKDF